MAPRRVSIGSGGAVFDESILDDGGSDTQARRSRDRGGERGRPRSKPFDSPWVRRILLTVTVVAVSVLPVATAAIAVFVDEDELVAWLQPRLSAAVNRQVTLGEAGVALFPRPGLRLSDIRVGGVGGSELPAVLGARDVRLEAALLPLLTGEVRVDRVRLGGLDVYLEITETGLSNFGDLVPESAAPEMASPGPVAFAVADVEVHDASFTWFDGRRDRSFGLSGLSGSVALGPGPDGGWAATVAGSGDSLLIRLPDLAEEIVRTDGPSLDLRLRGDEALEEIRVETGTIQHNGETLDIEGTVGGLSDRDPRLDLRLANSAFGLGALTALLPQSTRERSRPVLRGTADVSLSLRGSLREPDSPVLRGTLALSEAGLLLAGESRLEGVDGRVRLRDETVELDSIHGSFADGPFTLSATYQRDGGMIDGRLDAAPDVDDFERVGLAPENVELSGAAEIALDFAGPLSAPDSLAVSGSVHATGIQLEHPELEVPLYLPSADLAIDNSEVRWSELTLLIGTDALTVAGRLEGALAAWWREDVTARLEGAVLGGRLDLDALLPSATDGERPTYARQAFAHLAAEARRGGSAGAGDGPGSLQRPDKLPLHGVVEVVVDELVYRTHDLRDVRGTLMMSDTSLAVRDAVFTAWDGTGRLSLDLGVGSRAEEPFTVQLEARDADALTFFSTLTPVDRAVSGRLDLTLGVSGTVDREVMPVLESLEGGIEMTVTDGSVDGTGISLALADFLAEERWRTIPVSSWHTQISIQDGVLAVSQSRLESEMASARLRGGVGFGGAVDLAMALSIPPDRLEAVSLRRTGVAQTVLDRLRESGSPLELGIRLGGTLSGPTLEPDALAGAEREDGVTR